MLKAVETVSGRPAKYFNSQTVIEHIGDTEFARVVETYALDGHGTTKRAFIWERGNGAGEGDPTYRIVLKPDIFTAEAAVKSVARAIERRIDESAAESTRKFVAED